MRILLDPGHSRVWDNVVAGYSEATEMLALAKKMKAYGEANYPLQIDLTRTSMEPLNRTSNAADLKARAAKTKGYDLFYSVHSDAGRSTMSGNTVYGDIHPNYSDETLFGKIAKAISDVTGFAANRVRYREISDDSQYIVHYKPIAGKSNYYYVLRNAWAKVNVLVEHGFHTHEEERKLLSDSAMQDRIAKNVMDAIAAHYGIMHKEVVTVNSNLDAAQRWAVENKIMSDGSWTQEKKDAAWWLYTYHVRKIS